MGNNFEQMEINRPRRCPYANYERDSYFSINGNNGNGPNYYPNSFDGPVPSGGADFTGDYVEGYVGRVPQNNDDPLLQPKEYFLSLT